MQTTAIPPANAAIDSYFDGFSISGLVNRDSFSFSTLIGSVLLLFSIDKRRHETWHRNILLHVDTGKWRKGHIHKMTAMINWSKINCAQYTCVRNEREQKKFAPKIIRWTYTCEPLSQCALHCVNQKRERKESYQHHLWNPTTKNIHSHPLG